MATNFDNPYRADLTGSRAFRPGHAQGDTVQGDGVVDGSAGDDLIDLAYTGDPQGDMIDAADALLPGAGPDDDIVDALAGNDVIKAGVGDDDIYAGSGSDTVFGESGDDVIWGDSNAPGVTGETVRESLQWDLAPDPDCPGKIDDGDDLSGGFTQNTGSVDVTFTVEQETSGVDTEFTAHQQYVGSINTGDGPADANSALYSVLNGQVNSAEYKLDFADPVLEVSFRINDIDGDGVVQVSAFDGDGQPVVVNLSGGPDLTLSDGDSVPGEDTANSNGGYAEETNPSYSVLVTIPGPVSSLLISHDQDGQNNTGITVTDVYFNVPVADTGEDGDDSLYGGDGADTIYGEGGSDRLSGGKGNDFIDGGAGRDIMSGGLGNDVLSGSVTTAGDGGDRMFGGQGNDSFVGIGLNEFIDGGEDADGLDIDRFDKSDLQASAEAISPGGSYIITQDTGNSENGTITFFDASGGVADTSEFENIEMPCFTPGTLIATPKGERRVEDLHVGDRVITRDNGIQEIRWLGQRSLTGQELASSEHLNPVLVRQGTLGGGLPERDMLVSPNHRILVANDKTALYFEDREVLVSAKHLTGLNGVDVVAVSDVTYIHFMCEQHEVVLSDGAWTESFQPGDQSLKGIGNAQRNEIFELFPELNTREGRESYQSARRSLKKHEARLLIH